MSASASFNTIPVKYAGLSFREMLTVLTPISLCAVAMGAAVWIIGLSIRPFVSVSIQAATEVLAGVTIYACLVVGLRLKPGQEVLSLVAEKLWLAEVQQ